MKSGKFALAHIGGALLVALSCNAQRQDRVAEAETHTGQEAPGALATPPHAESPEASAQQASSSPAGPNPSCPPFTLPDPSRFQRSEALPDPFVFLDGRPVKTKADWACRRRELDAMLQAFVYGKLPEQPPEKVSGRLEGNTLTVTVSNQGRSVSFDVEITLPPNAPSQSAPSQAALSQPDPSGGGSALYPAVITLGGPDLLPASAIADQGVATIAYDHGAVAVQTVPYGRNPPAGKFYELYPESRAGSLIAWAWGAGRIIDALESLPQAQIEPKRLAVTGCSRNGKGALAVGAFEPRIALTLPVESGSGGIANFRMAQAIGPTVQRAGQLSGENTWMGDFLYQFANEDGGQGKDPALLPVDMHMATAMVAPRGLLMFGNDTQVWLCSSCGHGTAVATRAVYQALGVRAAAGYSLGSYDRHCRGFADSESHVRSLTAYVRRFLLDDASAVTDVYENNGHGFDVKRWAPWAQEPPQLQ